MVVLVDVAVGETAVLVAVEETVVLVGEMAVLVDVGVGEMAVLEAEEDLADGEIGAHMIDTTIWMGEDVAGEVGGLITGEM